jgi:hypothetical protein
MASEEKTVLLESNDNQPLVSSSPPLDAVGNDEKGNPQSDRKQKVEFVPYKFL